MFLTVFMCWKLRVKSILKKETGFILDKRRLLEFLSKKRLIYTVFLLKGVSPRKKSKKN